MEAIGEELTRHLGKVGSSPFLFVGSGLSRRYLGLDDWKGLLARFAELAGLNFQQVLGRADSDLPEAGAVIAREFYDTWWSSADFENQRHEYSGTVTRKDLPLKISISDHIRELSSNFDNFDSEFSSEIEAFRSVTVDGLITTNWDLMLEQLFPGYQPFVGQEELLFGSSQGIGEIYKIHGCCTNPESLVLTTEDYSSFNRRNPYLSAKLLSIFVDHPVIFLGYKLADPNVQLILSSISECLSEKNLEKLQDRLIFVERAKGEQSTITRRDQYFGSVRLPILTIRTDNFTPVYEAISERKRKIPARLLRLLRKQIYELVTETTPSGSVFVQDIDSATNTAEVDVVIGVGVKSKLDGALGKKGYKSITRSDLLRDVLRSESAYTALEIVDNVLPNLVKGGGTLTPTFRYIADAGLRFEDERWSSPLPPDLEKWTKTSLTKLQPTGTSYLSYRRSAIEHDAKGGGLGAIPAANRVRQFTIARFLPLAKFDLSELKKFLEDCEEEALSTVTSGLLTQYAALVCIFDLLSSIGRCGLELSDVSHSVSELQPDPE